MTKINVNVSDRKENGKPEFCRRLTGTILPWRLRRVWPSFISTLTQDPGRAQQEVCERDGFGFCHQQWSKSNLGTSESNQSISPVVFIQRERERPEDGGKDGGKRQTVRGWREAENLLCFQTSSSSLLPLSFYLSSLFLPPCLPVASCWDSHLLGNKAGLSSWQGIPSKPTALSHWDWWNVQLALSFLPVLFTWLQKAGGLFLLRFIFVEFCQTHVAGFELGPVCFWSF